MKNLVLFKRFAFVLMFISVLSLVSCSCRGCSPGDDTLDSNTHVCDWQINRTIQERSCVVDGVIEYVCSCGKEKTEVEKAVGHAFGEWISVCESTCLEPGQEKRICNSCSEEEISYTAKLEHSYSVSVEIINGVDISKYLCDICSDTFTIESLLIDGLDDISAKELYDCNADFSFEVISTEDEEYIKSHLDIYNAYFDGTEYETADGVVCSYYVVATGTDNVWKIVPTESYTAGYTYIARRSGSVVFKEYGLEPLTFSIYKPYTNEVEINSNVIFVQNLENASGGYYPFTIDFSEMSQKYWVTLGKVDGLKIGDIICVGNATSFDEVVSQNSDNYFGKIDSIEKTSTGGWLISLSEPPLDELFDKLDIYSSAITSLENFETAEDLEEQMVTALYEDVEFARFLSTAYVSAHEYAAERGMVAATGTFKDFVNSIKFSFIEKPEILTGDGTAYMSMKFELTGKVNIPVTVSDFAGNENSVGTVNIEFKAYVHLNTFFVKLHLSLGKFSWGKFDNGEVLDLCINPHITVGFSIDVATNVDYSMEATPYAYNVASGTYHYKNCKHVAMIKDKSKVQYVSTQTLLNVIADGNYFTKECGTCKPIEAMLSSSYVVNTGTKTVHTAGCPSVKTMSSNNMMMTERALSDLLANGYNKDCKNCNPSSVNLNAFDEKLINKIKYEDFGEYVDDVVEIANSAKSDGENRIPLGNLYFTLSRIDTEEITFYAYFKFHLDASLHYEYEIQYESIFGIKSSKNGIKDYSETIKNENTKNKITAVGETRIDVGLGVELSVYITGLERFIKGSVDANLGLYAKVHGALQIDFLDHSEDYYAAYFEAGAHCDVNIEFKIPLCDRFDKNLLNADLPILTMGYKRVVYRYVDIPDSLTVDSTTFSLNRDDLLMINYFDLIDMEKGTAKLSPLGVPGGYSVDFKLKNGDNCYIDEGVLYVTNSESEFTDELTVTVTGYHTWYDAKNNNTMIDLPSYTVTLNYHPGFNGLEFTSNGDGTCYVSGIGTCTDADIVIPDTSPAGDRVVAIGDWSFYDCNITSVEIPDSVTSIGISAFKDCDKLASVAIGDTISSIGYGAFFWCDSLVSIIVSSNNRYYQSIDGNLYTKDGKTLIQYAIGKLDSKFTVPNSVTSIGDAAFADCRNLVSVTIPESIISIGDEALAVYSGLTSIIVNSNNRYYQSIDGNLYTKDGKTLVQYAVGKKVTHFTVPEGVTAIGDYAFLDCTKLGAVVIRNSVTSIGDYAFKGCINLSYIYYTGSEEEWARISIGFDNSRFTNANIYCNFDPKDSIYSQGLAFTSNGDGTCYVDGIGGFTDTELKIPSKSPAGDTVTAIATAAFEGCTNLKSVAIPATITDLGTWTFQSCTSLENVIFEDGIKISAIGEAVFKNCVSIKSITIPKSVAVIGDAAFANLRSITSINIPANVTKIGAWAFQDCVSLQRVTMNPDGQLRTIGIWAFGNCSALKGIEIPETVTKIDNDAFANSANLAKVYYAGTQNRWTRISINDGNENLSNAKIYYNCNYEETTNIDSEIFIYVSNGDGSCYLGGINTCFDVDTQIKIPKKSPTGDWVISIGEDAFCECRSITSIYIPNTITTIGTAAFEKCYDLKSITIPSSVTNLGTWTFSQCYSLTNVVFDDNINITKLDEAVFRNCTSLKSISIPETVTSIGDAAFAFSGLTTLKIPNAVTEIGTWTFQDCVSLEMVTTGYYSQLKEIGAWAFGNCISIKEIDISGYITDIYDNAFANCIALSEVNYFGGLVSRKWEDICIVEEGNAALINAHISNIIWVG